MKKKVIAKILDGVICANKNQITCYIENSLYGTLDEYHNGADVPELKIGDILPTEVTNWTETYWSYSRKQWDKMNEEFNKLKK